MQRFNGFVSLKAELPHNIQEVKRIVVFITCMSTLLDKTIWKSEFAAITLFSLRDSQSDFDWMKWLYFNTLFSV